jgi:hypothetical protein
MSGTPRYYCAASFSVPVRWIDLLPHIRFPAAPHPELVAAEADQPMSSSIRIHT